MSYENPISYVTWKIYSQKRFNLHKKKLNKTKDYRKHITIKKYKITYSFSPSSLRYETAIARTEPSFEKLKDDMLL